MQGTELFRFIVLGLGLKQTWLEDSFEASRLVLPVLFVFTDTGLRLASVTGLKFVWITGFERLVV